MNDRNGFYYLVRQMSAVVLGVILPFVSTSAGGAFNQPAFERIKINDTEIVALLDGYFEVQQAWFALPTEVKQAYLEAGHRDKAKPIKTQITTYFLKRGDKNILIDTGSGTSFGANAGKMMASLKLAGIEPGTITDIFLTHVHTDHMGGLIEAQDKAVFPKATLWISKDDIEFWGDVKNKANTIAQASEIFDVAHTVLIAYQGQIKSTQANQILIGGIKAIKLPGHTPGHMGYLLEAGDQKVLFTGDMFVVGPIQLRDPSAAILFDAQGKKAGKTRAATLGVAARGNILLATSHWPFPGMGWVSVEANGFRFTPLQWPYGY